MESIMYRVRIKDSVRLTESQLKKADKDSAMLNVDAYYAGVLDDKSWFESRINKDIFEVIKIIITE